VTWDYSVYGLVWPIHRQDHGVMTVAAARELFSAGYRTPQHMQEAS
jgi:hypothetical protein